MATISENIQGIISSKENIRQAINNKGGTLAENAKLDTFAEAVIGLPSGDGGIGNIPYDGGTITLTIEALGNNTYADVLPWWGNIAKVHHNIGDEVQIDILENNLYTSRKVGCDIVYQDGTRKSLLYDQAPKHDFSAVNNVIECSGEVMAKINNVDYTFAEGINVVDDIVVTGFSVTSGAENICGIKLTGRLANLPLSSYTTLKNLDLTQMSLTACNNILGTNKSLEQLYLNGCTITNGLSTTENGTLTTHVVLEGCHITNSMSITLRNSVAISYRERSCCRTLGGANYPFKNMKIAEFSNSGGTGQAYCVLGSSVNNILEYVDYGNFNNGTGWGGVTGGYMPSLLTTIRGRFRSAQNYNMSACPLLTYESAMVLINGLASDVSDKTLTLNNNTKRLLSSADIAIATDKGWTIA